MAALHRLEDKHKEDIFYSGVFAMSKADTEKIRELILNFIKEKGKILDPSNEEMASVLNLDFFTLSDK
jgi:hypothetical protein